MVKALGRCKRKHGQVVEYPEGTVPAGVCAKCGGEPLIEWAVKPRD